MDKEIEKSIKQMKDDAMIGPEDEENLRVILTWLKHGRQAAENVNRDTVQTLIKQGFADEKVMITQPDDMDNWLMMALLGANGLIEQ